MLYTHKTLKNGLTVFLVNVPDAESVVFSIFVKVGSRYEHDRIAGVAHFLEHVFFKGSRNYPQPTAMSSLIDGIGGEFNAATGKESTEYYIRAEKHNFDLIFDVLTDMLQNPLFNEVEIEKEKGVVVEEINLYQDNPGAQVESDLERIMWPEAQLGWDVIGSEKTVTNLSREDIFSFKEQFYQPENIILGISGNFDEKHVLERIQESWSFLRNKKSGTYEKATALQTKPTLRIEHKPTKQAHLALGFKSFEHNNKKNSATLLLSSILGGSMSSRLFTIIREQKGLAYFVRAGNTQYFDTGSFTIHAGLKVNQTLDALRAILAEIRKIKTDFVTAAELQKSKDYIKGRVALSLEDNQDKLNWVVERYAFTGKVETPKELFERLDKVTVQDVNKVANEIFQNNRMSMALIGPFKNRKEFEKELYLKENY